VISSKGIFAARDASNPLLEDVIAAREPEAEEPLEGVGGGEDSLPVETLEPQVM